MKKINVILSILIYLFAAGYFYMITTLPDRNMPGTLKSSFMPMVLVSLLFITNTVFVLKSVIKPVNENCDFVIHKYEISGILKIVAIIIAYVYLMRIIGFVFITPFVVFILMKMMGADKLKELIPASILVSVVVYYLFVVFFRVQLPGGFLL